MVLQAHLRYRTRNRSGGITVHAKRKVGRAFLPDPEALESQPGMADLPRLPEQLRFINRKASHKPGSALFWQYRSRAAISRRVQRLAKPEF